MRLLARKLLCMGEWVSTTCLHGEPSSARHSVHARSGTLLERKLLYTGVTRTQQLLLLVATQVCKAGRRRVCGVEVQGGGACSLGVREVGGVPQGALQGRGEVALAVASNRTAGAEGAKSLACLAAHKPTSAGQDLSPKSRAQVYASASHHS